jgi:transaldolase
MNPIRKLQEFGQSVYLDEISRTMLQDGTLDRYIEVDGLHGVTSNPAIFQKAIAESNAYDEAIAQLVAAGSSVAQIYESLVIQDIQVAADKFRALYDESDGRYGMVSLEVSPHLADDTEGTIREARHLWERLDRPNTFIKVPGTKAGLPAITQLISEGINVNITLLFGLQRYREVVDAWLAGLEQRLAAGGDLGRVASVASFFLSRIDVLLDPQLEKIAQAGQAGADVARGLLGKVAIANAKLAYEIYLEMLAGERFARLKAAGARPQELLWASTGTKNPAYSDTMYVEPLIGPDTINTMPVSTLDAYRDHGRPADRIRDGLDEARAQLAALQELGISLDEGTAQLEVEGVRKFVGPFDSLLDTLAKAAAK